MRTCVSHDSPTTCGALPPRSFLTTSVSSAPAIRKPIPGSPGPASSPQGVSGAKGLIELLFQPDGIPYRRVLPPPQALTTLRPQHRSATSTMEARNMAHLTQCPLSPEPGVPRRPSQYVWVCQVLPAPYRTQLTTRWWSVDIFPLSSPVSRTCGRKSNNMTTKSIIKLAA